MARKLDFWKIQSLYCYHEILVIPGTLVLHTHYVIVVSDDHQRTLLQCRLQIGSDGPIVDVFNTHLRSNNSCESHVN